MTKQDRIINLSAYFTPDEVADIVGSSHAYVYNVLSKHRKSTLNPNKRALSLENYINAYHIGITAKADLAAYFEVSRMTLNRFENKTGISIKLKEYINLCKNKYNFSNIHSQLLYIYEFLLLFEKGSNREKQIKKILELLVNVSK